MTLKEIEKSIVELQRNVLSGRLTFALDTLKTLIRQSTRSDFFYELESIEENYRSLLKYSFEGYSDPRRDEILCSLEASILNLSDELASHLLEDSSPYRKLANDRLTREFGTDPSAIAEKIDEIFISHEVSELIEHSGTQTSPVTDDIFKLIWIARELKDHHVNLIKHINKDDGVEWYEKCLVVSSLTLSLLSYFDPKKIELLSEFIVHRQAQVYHRALTGLVIALCKYNDRIRFYPEMIKLIDDLSMDEDIRKDVETIILQLLMAGETERITKEFEQEVLPDMQKMMPKLGDKLQLDNVVEEDPEGENPVWKEMIDEVPGLFEKIEKFSRMQMEGADVFMSTFSMLKRFDFFNKMSHWFIPFYHGHPSLQDGEGDDAGIRTRLMEGLEKAFYICNSDKYSFALNFKAIPSQQRSMIVTHFEAELEQMKEVASEEEILDPAMISNAIFTQYIQDLYRFYKLFPQKAEFDDIFKWKLSYSKLDYLQKFSDQESFSEQVATFYFSKDHWEESTELYQYQESTGRTSSQLYQKLGYAWQKTRNWEKALDAYRKAELFDTDRLWVLKKMVWCSIRLEDFNEALIYLQEALKLRPDDLNLMSQAGQCHLNLKNYSEAARYYNMLWSVSPGNMKALRPIAYCKFTLGKLEEAKEAYHEIFESAETNTPYDFMNAGHVALCLGEREQALKHYRSALEMPGFTKEIFQDTFMEDCPYLYHHNVDEKEIPLILDYIFLSKN